MAKVKGEVSTDNLKKVSGSVIIRESSAVAPDGRKIVMVCGLVAVPENFPLKGEHQYIVAGRVDEALDGVSLHVFTGTELDVREKTEHLTPSQWFTSPIWRV